MKRAVINAIEENIAKCPKGLKLTNIKARKPKLKTTVIIMRGKPTASNEYATASSGDFLNSLLARSYLLRRCTVKSTIIPRVEPIPTATINPTFPLTNAQIPNAVPIGSMLGNEEIIPKRKDLKKVPKRIVIRTNPRNTHRRRLLTITSLM